MAYTVGTKAVGDVLSDIRIFNLNDAQVFEPAKSEVQWLSFLMKLSKRPTDSTEFKELLHAPAWTNHQFYAGGTGTWSSNAIANLTVEATVGGSDNVGFLTVGLVCRAIHATGNDTVFVITNVDTQQQIDVRSLPGAGANETNLADGDKIQVIGTAMGETSSAGESLEPVLTASQFYTQDFEDTFAMSDVGQAEGVWGPDQFNFAANDSLKIHKTKINRSALLGALDSETITLNGESVTVRSSYGLVTFCEDNSPTLMDSQGVVTQNYNSYSYDAFVDHMEGLFALGSEGKVAVVGSGVLGYFSKMGTGSLIAGANVTIENQSEVFGINITKIRTNFGTLNLLWDKVFRTSGFYADHMAIADLAYSSYRPFSGKGKNLDTHLMTNIQNNNQFRIQKNGYRTVAGCSFVRPETAGLFKFS